MIKDGKLFDKYMVTWKKSQQYQKALLVHLCIIKNI